MSAEVNPSTSPAPRIWLVLGDKLGDNAQVSIIAAALGLPYEVRRVLPRPEYVLGKPPFKASLYHLDAERSDRLEPPWPDLILTVGRRPSMAAMWIREQSGGRSRVVLLGRPKKMLDQFALVIATGQYRVPARENVLHLELPLMRVSPERLERAAADWEGRLAALPRPLTAVLVGGPTKPFVLDAAVAENLMDLAAKGADGGTLYFTTSRRTPEPLVEAIRSVLPAGALLFQWTPEAEENPYLGLLALADRFVVTGDSISMMLEVARLGKPLAIFPLPTGSGVLGRLRRAVAKRLYTDGKGALVRLLDLLQRIGAMGYARDLPQLHANLFAQGLAVKLGDPFLAGGRTPVDELALVVERVRALLG